MDEEAKAWAESVVGYVDAYYHALFIAVVAEEYFPWMIESEQGAPRCSRD